MKTVRENIKRLTDGLGRTAEFVLFLLGEKIRNLIKHALILETLDSILELIEAISCGEFLISAGVKVTYRN